MQARQADAPFAVSALAWVRPGIRCKGCSADFAPNPVVCAGPMFDVFLQLGSSRARRLSSIYQ